MPGQLKGFTPYRFVTLSARPTTLRSGRVTWNDHLEDEQ